MKDSEIKAKLQKGWIRTIITFEVVGRPAEHVTDALAKYMANIKRDERIIIIQEETESPIEHEDGMFSTFCEADMLVQNLEVFTWLCINFSPASIEILEPTKLEIDGREITNWLNDLLAKVHEVGMNHRAAIAVKDHLTIAMNQLIKNALLLSLRQGPRTEKQLETDTGIQHEQLKPFLDHLVEKKQVVFERGAYRIA